MSLKKQQVNIDPKTALAMSAALNDIRALRTKHDGRILGLALLDQAASVYGHLVKTGKETLSGADSMFQRAMTRVELAQNDKAQTKIVDLAVLGEEVPKGKLS